MLKKFLVSIIFIVVLVACGQDMNQDKPAEPSDEDTTETKSTEADTENTDKENANKETDEDQEKATEASTDTSENNKSSTGPLSELKVHYIDVGQADATLFQYEEEGQSYTILFDTGDWKRNDAVNYLASQNIPSIDLIVASHPDADHIGQLAEIVNTYDVGEVWMSGNESSSQTFQRAAEAVLSSDADFHEPRTGEEFDIGPMEIKVLHPGSISGKTNEESISLLFTYGEVKFLFTGDADQNAESQMLNSGINVDADILQLGHHGSKTSSAPAFIKAVNPSVAIYSAGTDNSYGHPHAEVVSRIQNAGITLYGTDVHGTIIVTTDGKEYSILTNKDGTISPKSTGSADSSSNNQETDTGKDSNDSNTKKENTANGCIDINDASSEEVQEIIHIGPARAKDLIDQRPYNSVDDLSSIKGIGPSRIADIKSQGLACVKE